MNRIPVKPKILVWARERAGKSQEELIKKFERLPEWEEGKILPTLRQLEEFARTVHIPIGYLFFTEPLDEPLPIADFRTTTGQVRPSPNLQRIEKIAVRLVL